MSTIKRTVIKADEELVIKGKLTIEGNVTQLEQTNVITVTNLAGNVFTVNSVDPANPAVSNTTAVLSLNSYNTQANLAYSNTTGKLAISVPIELAANSNIETTGNVVAGWFRGDGSNITGLTTSIVAEGTRLYFTQTRVRSNISVTDNGGDGSLSYDTANGIITYTGPSAAEVRAHLSATNGIDYNNTTGIFNLSSSTAGNGLVYASGILHVGQGDGITVNADNVAVDSTVVRTQNAQDVYGVKTFQTGVVLGANINLLPETNNTSSIGNSTNWIKEIYSNVVHAHTINLGEDANLEDVHNTFYTGTAANAITTRNSDGLTYSHNSSGAYYSVNAGDGLQIDANTNVAVDSTVIRTSGDQSITGNITLTGNLAITGNLDVTANINSLNVVDLNVQDTQIILNSNAASGANSTVSVNRGGDPSVYLKWDEDNNIWLFTNDGTTELPIPVNTTDLAEGSNLYFTTDRANSAMDDYLIGGDGLTYSSGNISIAAGDGITVNADNVAVDATVVRTSGDQTLSGIKRFTGELVIPNSSPTSNNTIYVNASNTAVFAYVNGVHVQLTAETNIGMVETPSDAANANIEMYAGYRQTVLGNNLVNHHGIKGLNQGSYITLSESSNIVTIASNISAIKGAFSVSNLSGFGNLSYDNSTGTISYTGTSNADIRGLFSGSGLISYNSGTGAITTTADNYSSWSVQTDSGAGAKTAISSGHTLNITGGSGVTVTNTGNTISIAGLSADITAVTAGDGLTGGGTSGDVTLNVVAGAGITVNADNVAVNSSYIRGLVSATDAGGDGSFSYNSSTGAFTYTGPSASEANARMDAYLVGGAGLTYSSGTFAVGAGNGITVNADNVAVNMSAFSTTNLSEGTNLYYTTARANSAMDAYIAGGAGLTYSSGTLAVGAGTGITVNADNVAVNMSAFSTTNLSEGTNLYYTTARANSAMDAYLVGGSGLTYSSGTFAVGAGSYILVAADTISVDAASTNTANKVVVRDSNGSFAANVITATATSARYADLAENYLADADYLPGTVLVFGGAAEVTESIVGSSTKVAGVVTTNPAHVMNSDLTGTNIACIALRGRVPVKVKGIVRKGDVIVTSGEGYRGCGVSSIDPEKVPAAAIIGKAIADKLDPGVGLVEVMV